MRARGVCKGLLGLFLLSGLILGDFTTARAAESAPPYLFLDEVPAYDAGDSVTGSIRGVAEYGSYAITAYVRVAEGGAFWGPKPTRAQPTVRADGQGAFSLRFNTGGDDRRALEIAVFLVPAEFHPTEDMEATRRAALSTASALRDRAGTVRVEPAAEAFVDALPLPTGGKERLSMTFSPYVGGLSPERSDGLSEGAMKRLVAGVRPYCRTVRVYGVSGELEKLLPLLRGESMRIVAGCWFDGRYPRTQVQAELDALVRACNRGLVDVAVVGNELLLRGDVDARTLAGYIRYVREAVKDRSIPVGTADVAASFCAEENRAVVEACDVVLINSHPYFAGAAAEDAVGRIAEEYTRVRAVSGGRRVVISEAGFPTRGSAKGEANPSMESAKRVFGDVLEWSRAQRVSVFFHEAYDAAWKTEPDVEAHWGIFAGDGRMKTAYAEALPDAVR